MSRPSGYACVNSKPGKPCAAAYPCDVCGVPVCNSHAAFDLVPAEGAEDTHSLLVNGKPHTALYRCRSCCRVIGSRSLAEAV